MNKTITPSLETIERNWFLVDAKDKTLGRLATEIATVLRGKNKPTFTPHLRYWRFCHCSKCRKS